MKLTLQELQGVTYHEATNAFGQVVDVDLLNGVVTVKDFEGEVSTLSITDVKFLRIIGKFGEDIVLDGDLFRSLNTTDKLELYQIELSEDGQLVRFSYLDEDLEKEETGDFFDKAILENVATGKLELIGNINDKDLFEEEDDSILDFNIKIVKDTNDGTYYYACVNAEENVIDLIKVVFIGANLLEEQYSRNTIDNEEYVEYVKEGLLVEVTPSELQSYAYQLSRKQVITSVPSDILKEDDNGLCYDTCEEDCTDCLDVDDEDGECVMCNRDCDCKTWQ